MSNVNHIGTPKALSPAQLHSTENKAFRANKAYGSLDPNFDYSGWLEEARAWVAAVHSGQAQDDPQMPVAQYEQTIAEVEAMIFGGGAGGMGSGNWGLPGGGLGQPQVQAPPGAYVGPEGNFVFDGKDAELVYDGNPQRSDVSSENVTLAVNSMEARYSFSMVPDPVTGEQVLKVVIDSQRGQQTYVFSNVMQSDGTINPDFHMDLFAANPEDVNLDGLPQEVQDAIKVGETEDLENELANPQSSIEGTPIEGEDNAYKYTATLVTDVIDFYPTAGDNEAHYVTGNTTINIPLDSSATVAPIMDGSKPGYNYVVVVTHQEPLPNGSTDTFYLKGGSFDHHINGLPENISFLTGANPDGTPIAETGKVPTGYQDDFTIYGAEGAGAAAFPGDSIPDSSVADPAANGAVTNTYNTQADVTIHAGNAENCTTHDIYATGTVNISAADNQTQVTIDRQDDGTIVIMTPASDGTVEIFKVHPGTAGLPNIAIAGNNIVYGPGLGGPGADGALTPIPEEDQAAVTTALGKITINGNAAQVGEAGAPGLTAPTRTADQGTFNTAHPATVYESDQPIAVEADFDANALHYAEVHGNDVTVNVQTGDEVLVIHNSGYYLVTVVRNGDWVNRYDFSIDDSEIQNLNIVGGTIYNEDHTLEQLRGDSVVHFDGDSVADKGASAALSGLTSLTGTSQDDILSAAQSCDIDLNNLPVNPLGNEDFIEFLGTIDRRLREKINAFLGNQSDSNYAAIRDRIVELINKIYGEGSIVGRGTSDNTYVDDVNFQGGGWGDIIDQDKLGNVDPDDPSTFFEMIHN